MMRTIYFAVIVFYLVLISCKKDAELLPKEYPYAITKEVIVSKEGAVFSADFLNRGEQKILNYGFVWSENSKPTISDNHRLFQGNIEKGIFTYSLNSGLAKGKTYHVRACVLTGQYIIYSNVISFVSLGSLPPEITSFSPKFGPKGTHVSIDGNNFSPLKSGNIVKFGNIIANVDSSSENKIFVTIPEITTSETVHISVITGDMTVYSKDFFELWFPWLQKRDFEYVNSNSANFSIGNYGYVINSNNTTMLMYDPVKDEWKNTLILPENSGYTPFAFSINEIAYVFLKNDFWQYNPSTNNWVKKEKFPGILQGDRRYIFGMNIGRNIYIGNCYKSSEFWEYNTDQDIWQRKADFVGKFVDPVWGNFAFSSNNRGFLGVSQTGFALNTLWEYNPLNNSWSSKSPLPSTAYGYYCSFVINDNAFVGLGNNFDWGDGYVSNKLWKYDSQHDQWINIHDCPVNMAVYSSFSINNKGYIVSGFTKYYNDLNNVWEFDPSKN